MDFGEIHLVLEVLFHPFWLRQEPKKREAGISVCLSVRLCTLLTLALLKLSNSAIKLGMVGEECGKGVGRLLGRNMRRGRAQ